MTEVHTTSILELAPDEARELLLSPQGYCSLDLPNYFDLSSVLSRADDIVQGRVVDPYKNGNPKVGALEGVNHRILGNKDGMYAWRPFQLIHPVLYVELVDLLTEPGHWKLLTKRFSEFASDPNIRCMSIPVIEAEKSLKEASILNWWRQVEQESVRLSLNYTHVAVADITDCYGALYTHTVVWALHGKSVGQQKRSPSNRILGDKIDFALQDFHHRQTNGIPQGNLASDLIAEMVLGYADMQLSKALPPELDYRLIRYRDDYRIFTNSAEDAHEVLHKLTSVLESLNFKLNAAKTRLEADVIEASVKPDKLYWWGVVNSRRSLFKTLMLIRKAGQRFPNSGTLATALRRFRERIDKLSEEPRDNDVLISVVVDLMYKHPRLYSHASAVLSKLLSFKSDGDALQLISDVNNRFDRVPNVGLLEVWLQRFSQKYDPSIEYEEKLCRVVSGKQNVELWNSDWLVAKAKDALRSVALIDQAKLQSAGKVISLEETELFLRKYDEDIDDDE